MERIETSWGLIIRDQYSLFIRIEGVGVIEIYGNPMVHMTSGRIIISAITDLERLVKVVECDLKE